LEIWWNLGNPTEPRWEWSCLQFWLIDSSVPNERVWKDTMKMWYTERRGSSSSFYFFSCFNF
ncbi:hypothetical protein BAE44_0003656, partial [Dichanthelium oligosanthes]